LIAEKGNASRFLKEIPTEYKEPLWPNRTAKKKRLRFAKMPETGGKHVCFLSFLREEECFGKMTCEQVKAIEGASVSRWNGKKIKI
jgi:hypothetical protein